jgi:hypothetical protein
MTTIYNAFFNPEVSGHFLVRPTQWCGHRVCHYASKAWHGPQAAENPRGNPAWEAIARTISALSTVVFSLFCLLSTPLALVGLATKYALYPSLREAALNGSLPSVKEIIAAPNFQSIPDNEIQSIFMEAYQGRHLPVAQALIQTGRIHPETVQTIPSYVLPSLLVLAARTGDLDLVKMIIVHPNFQMIPGLMIMYSVTEAIQHRHLSLAQTLIQTNCVVPETLGEWLVPAAERGDLDLVKMIIAVPNFQNIPDNEILTSFKLALKNRHLSVAQALIQTDRVTSVTLGRNLLSAAGAGHLDSVEMIIATTAFQNIPNETVIASLQRAHLNGHLSVAAALLRTRRIPFNRIPADYIPAYFEPAEDVASSA